MTTSTRATLRAAVRRRGHHAALVIRDRANMAMEVVRMVVGGGRGDQAARRAKADDSAISAASTASCSLSRWASLGGEGGG